MISKKAKGSEPSFVARIKKYANALIGGGDLLKEADQYSLEALNKLLWVPSVKGTRGTVLLELGKIEEAIPLLRETMQKHENFGNKAQNACWLAIAEIRRGDRIAGQKYLEEARKFDPACFLINRVQNVLDTTAIHFAVAVCVCRDYPVSSRT